MDIRIEKTTQGYEAYLDGKLYRIYKGSQDIRQLYRELKTSHSRVCREMEMESIGKEWWRRMELGMEPDTWYDAIFVLLEAKLRKRAASR